MSQVNAEIDGKLATRDCKLSYSLGGNKLAVAVVHCDLEGLRCEVEFERAIADNLSHVTPKRNGQTA